MTELTLMAHPTSTTTITPTITPSTKPAPTLIEQQHCRKINWAMFVGGTSAFCLLYSVQPMMPMLSDEFQLSATQASWVLSISTFTLAFALLVSSLLSEFIDRRRLMLVAVSSTALITLLCPLAQSYEQLLWLRALLGFALGGMPALAVTYLSSEVPAARRSHSIGLYIAGTAFGGMLGRLFGAVLSDLHSWRFAMFVLAVAGILAAWQFKRALPATRLQPTARADRHTLQKLTSAVLRQLPQSRLLGLFLIAFLLTGSYTGFYNYITFYLLAAPYNFSQSAIGALALFYLFGIGSSIWGGMLLKRWQVYRLLPIALSLMVIGLGCTLHPDITLILVGVALFTFGFFAAHTLCSNWLANLVQAPKALMTAVYLCCYYLGSSTLGALTGIGWDLGGWPALVNVLGSLVLTALLLATYLAYQAAHQPVSTDVDVNGQSAKLHQGVELVPSSHQLEPQTAMTAVDWQKIGTLFKQDPDWIQLENGYVGMQPEPVFLAWQQHQLRVNQQGARYLRGQFASELADIYQSVADFFGVLPNELLFTRNLSEGMHILLHGYPLVAGDEVICAGQDYDTVLASLQHLSDLKKIHCRRLHLPVSCTDARVLLHSYETAITARTRLIVISHMCHRHGQILPVAQISQMARRYGVDVIVDAAHSFAQLNYGFTDLDADFIAVNLHKWFGAPLGSGLIFIRQHRISSITPTYSAIPEPQASTQPQTSLAHLAPAGTPAVATLLNIADALAFYQAIGPAEKEQRLRQLTQYWLTKAQKINGIHVVTPMDPSCYCAIGAFYLDNHSADTVVAELWQRAQIFAVSRMLYQQPVVRVTVQVFTQFAELDVLVKTLRQLAAANDA